LNVEPLNPGNNVYILNPKNLRSSAAKNGICYTMNIVRFAHNWNIGMMEYWNTGIMGLKRHSAKGRGQRAESKEFFHHALCSMRSACFHSMCEAKTQASKNSFIFNEL
jgi:hypothetical protein